MRKKERMEDETYEEERNGGRRKIAQLMSLIASPAQATLLTPSMFVLMQVRG